MLEFDTKLLELLILSWAIWITNADSILWINTTYQATDNGIDISRLKQCKAWQMEWLMQVYSTHTALSSKICERDWKI